MIPGLLASEISAALKEFIVTGYETETEPFRGEFRRLVEEQQDGEAFIKGPYISIGLPFRPGSAGRDFFSGFETDHPPYAHQEQAWQRLASDRQAANTLVATGTGSGKTECFLYPILDHCQRAASPGIKAIVIYPMNALATDQARRFAEVVHSRPALRGLRVGLFVGGEDRGNKVMTADQVITDRETLRDDPPDVLLTNYKMLDYLLLRPQDQKLWAHNGPDTLRYLVVDELHTFDGAQGTDLSLLIRRLRARFGMTAEQLICVGTSATLGGEDSLKGLLQYASDIFSSPFSRDSVIAEQRMTDTDFLDNIIYLQLNRETRPEDLAQALEQGLDAYLRVAYRLFFGRDPELPLDTLDGRIRLGNELKQHGQVANLLRELGRRRGTPAFAELVHRFTPLITENFARQPEQVVVALLALLAHARSSGGRPFVQLRIQLWCRELRRIVGVLREPRRESDNVHEPADAGLEHLTPPLLSFGDDQLRREGREIRLPLVQCRECHGSAWLTRMEAGVVSNQVLKTDLAQIYSAFFSRHAETALLMPWQGEQPQSPAGTRLQHFRVCRHCGQTTPLDYEGPCRGCQAGHEALVRVSRPDLLRGDRHHKVNRLVFEPDCPWCTAKSALVVFGARAASLGSVAIHQLFSSRDNDDRKLLAFSDSVQDAAHCAGFFAARTWHNNVRMALTQMLEASDGPVPLTELPQRFERFWLNHGGWHGRLDLPAYLREFMPPDKRYRGDFEYFEQSGEVRDPEPLLRLIRQRMLWQLLEDLGWRAQVGRSLNRLGIAALSWPLERVGHAARQWADTVDNTLGYRISSAAAAGFMTGLMQHLAATGAFGLEDLRQYRHQAGKAYLLNLVPYAPPLGPGSPRPRYPATVKGEGYELLVHSSVSHSWYERWLACVNPEELADRKQLELVLVAAFEALAAAGLVSEECNARGARLWMLNPQMLQITTDIQAAECAGYRPLPLPAAHVGQWLGLPLLSAASPDLRYRKAVPVRDSLYRRLFRTGEIHRVIAHEHTGLLPASERIRVEESFIRGDKPWSYNLLSATPTLEMGIDIGDLSSVLLCSVPPAQANYLQRIGRGGRRDGNSFVLTVANGRPHDLVFYADPARMLDSPVEPPAVFLKARHVLRRQLLAYAMDCWTHAAKGGNQVPATMQPVLDAVEKAHLDRFPYTLLDFISRNMQEIWDGFAAYVATELEDEDLELLRQYLFGGPHHPDDHLKLYLLGRLQLVADERRQMTATIRSLERQLEKLRQQPQDEHTRSEIGELGRELAGFRSLRRNLNQRETLNFFTDEGLLPNYAFPEEGAILHSIIFRSERLAGKEGAEQELIQRKYEYQRPAQAALSELAPESVFYAGNRKVRISRVETAKGRNIQDWRFCPRCHYSAPADDPRAGYSDKVCPRCNSRQWADESARTRMLKMTQVYAFTSAKEAQLDDSSDEREPVFFNRQMLIDFDPSDIQITWVMEDRERPFGFEFIRSANFLEVNFGRRDSENIVFEVAGEQLQRAGFPICRECGSVQSRRAAAGREEARHLKNCSYGRGPKKLPDGSEDTGIENCLYLYRQFSSEALRILLPRLSTGGTEEQVNSFVAALQLGLKRRFGGKVDHLRVAYQSEPVGETDERRHFIVLYDSVPGGTGYLHELLSKAENMQSVFRMAYEVMKNCDCYDHTMDGCYRCLLEYRNAYGMESTSKALAMEMLADIVEGEHTWVRKEDSLSTLAANPWVDSELEARFPEALARFSGAEAVAGKRVRVSQDVVRGKHGWRLVIGDLTYDMEPQVDLGAAEGVRFACRPDFVLWPARSGLKPVAVFLDGYRYHANRINEDLIKRQSLMHAGFVVWSLNWYDINQVMGDKAMEVPQLAAMTSAEQNQRAVSTLAQMAGIKHHRGYLNRTSFELLMHFLAEQDAEALAWQALLFVFQCMPAKVFTDTSVKQQVQKNLEGLPVSFTDLCPSRIALAASVRLRAEEADSVIRLDMLVAPELLRSGGEPAHALVSLCYEAAGDDDETSRYQWQRLWTLVSFLQFLPAFYAWTPESRSDGTAAGLLWPARGSAPVPARPEPGWLEYLDESLAARLREADIDMVWPGEPLVGEAVMNGQDEVVGEAELMFPDARVALLLDDVPDQVAARPHLEAAGWQVFTDVEALLEAMEETSSGA